MAPGIYTIKDGPLLVNGTSTLTGENVGIYLKGEGSNLKFDSQTTISLTAPKDGPMVGLLIFDDPTGASALVNLLVNPLMAGTYTKLLSSPREHLILTQTPQVFQYALLKRAFGRAAEDGFVGTDEASLVERMEEVEVSVVQGSDRNIKITKPSDMDLARLFAKEEAGLG